MLKWDARILSKKEINLSLFTGDMTVCWETQKEQTNKNFLELRSNYGKVEWYKVNIKMSILYNMPSMTSKFWN